MPIISLSNERLISATLVTPGTFPAGIYYVTDGLKLPSVYPAANSTTAFQIRKADNATAVVSVDTTNVRVGVNIVAPVRRVDILDASNPQLRLTQADGSKFVDFQATSGGGLMIAPSTDSTTAIKVNKADNATPVVTINTTDGNMSITGSITAGNITATPTASKIPIADASGTLDAWIFGGGYLVDNTPPVDGMYTSYLLVGGMVVT